MAHTQVDSLKRKQTKANLEIVMGANHEYKCTFPQVDSKRMSDQLVPPHPQNIRSSSVIGYGPSAFVSSLMCTARCTWGYPSFFSFSLCFSLLCSSEQNELVMVRHESPAPSLPTQSDSNRVSLGARRTICIVCGTASDERLWELCMQKESDHTTKTHRHIANLQYTDNTHFIWWIWCQNKDTTLLADWTALLLPSMIHTLMKTIIAELINCYRPEL